MPTLLVELAAVKPNKWNYNTQTPAVFQKVVESIRRYGFSDPIVVRNLGSDKYEIINGEHRYRAAIELGMKQVPVFTLGVVDDVKAKQLCITLNELSGSPDEVRLATLMRDIASKADLIELADVMPYSGNEIRQMIDSVDFSFSKMTKNDTRPEPPPEPDEVPPPKVTPVARPTKGVRLSILVAPSRLAAVDPKPAAALVKLLDWWESLKEKAQ